MTVSERVARAQNLVARVELEADLFRLTSAERIWIDELGRLLDRLERLEDVTQVEPRAAAAFGSLREVTQPEPLTPNVCACGKEFLSPRALGGHKTHCKAAALERSVAAHPSHPEPAPELEPAPEAEPKPEGRIVEMSGVLHRVRPPERPPMAEIAVETSGVPAFDMALIKLGASLPSGTYAPKVRKLLLEVSTCQSDTDVRNLVYRWSNPDGGRLRRALGIDTEVSLTDWCVRFRRVWAELAEIEAG